MSNSSLNPRPLLRPPSNIQLCWNPWSYPNFKSEQWFSYLPARYSMYAKRRQSEVARTADKGNGHWESSKGRCQRIKVLFGGIPRPSHHNQNKQNNSRRYLWKFANSPTLPIRPPINWLHIFCCMHLFWSNRCLLRCQCFCRGTRSIHSLSWKVSHYLSTPTLIFPASYLWDLGEVSDPGTLTFPRPGYFLATTVSRTHICQRHWMPRRTYTRSISSSKNWYCIYGALPTILCGWTLQDCYEGDTRHSFVSFAPALLTSPRISYNNCNLNLNIPKFDIW